MNFNNTIWYSFGAASSVVAHFCYDRGLEAPGRHPTDAFTAGALIVGVWITFFLFTALFFNLHRLVFFRAKLNPNEKVYFLIPLFSGLLYVPLSFVTFCLIMLTKSGNSSLIILSFIVPSGIGFEIVRLAINRNRKAPPNLIV